MGVVKEVQFCLATVPAQLSSQPVSLYLELLFVEASLLQLFQLSHKLDHLWLLLHILLDFIFKILLLELPSRSRDFIRIRLSFFIVNRL